MKGPAVPVDCKQPVEGFAVCGDPETWSRMEAIPPEQKCPETEFVEHRKHKRYRVKEDAFAWLKGDAIRLGQVVDISPGGLAFQYISDAGPSKGSQELGIFVADSVFRLDGIQARIVSDFDVSEPHSLGYVPLRRCGVQFEDLDPHQAPQLKHFVEEHATGEA